MIMIYSKKLTHKCLSFSLHKHWTFMKTSYGIKVLTNNINVSRSDKVIKTLKPIFSFFSKHTFLFLLIKYLYIFSLYIVMFHYSFYKKLFFYSFKKYTNKKKNWLHSQPKLLSLWQFSEFSNNIFSTKYSEIKRNNNKEENIFSWNSLAIIMVYIRDRMNNDGRSKSTFIWEKMQKSSGMLSTLPQLSL